MKCVKIRPHGGSVEMNFQNLADGPLVYIYERCVIHISMTCTIVRNCLHVLQRNGYIMVRVARHDV